jgi:hypothetical protein
LLFGRADLSRHSLNVDAQFRAFCAKHADDLGALSLPLHVSREPREPREIAVDSRRYLIGSRGLKLAQIFSKITLLHFLFLLVSRGLPQLWGGIIRPGESPYGIKGNSER